MFNNFDFVEGVDPLIAEDLNLAEEYLYSLKDPNGCMLKVGVAMERLVIQHIAPLEEVKLRTYRPDLSDYLKELEHNYLLPEKVLDALHYIRIRKNDASHEGFREEYDAQECLIKSHLILSWFVEFYEFGMATNYEEPDLVHKLIDGLILVPR